MWLSEKTGEAGIERAGEADYGRITIGGKNPAVETDGEHRSPVILSPGGLSWLPSVGQEAVLLRCQDGTEVLLGCAQSGAPEGMLPGEVYIKSGTASVHIGLTGMITVIGKVNIIGNLTVNGRAV